VGSPILLESALSFLGLGTTEPNTSWGLMLTGGSRTYLIPAPWMAIFPGLAISPLGAWLEPSGRRPARHLGPAAPRDETLTSEERAGRSRWLIEKG
jgi:hypothetical protein